MGTETSHHHLGSRGEEVMRRGDEIRVKGERGREGRPAGGKANEERS